MNEKKYKIVVVNYDIAKTVNELTEDGYIPIGRAFEMFKCQYQTVVHKSVLNSLGMSKNNAVEKYKTVSGTNEHFLEDEVNKSIEEGYIPSGRMYLIGDYGYSQTMVHASIFKDLKTFVKKGVIEGR